MRRIMHKLQEVVEKSMRFTKDVFISKLRVGEFEHGMPMEKFSANKRNGFMKGDGTITDSTVYRPISFSNNEVYKAGEVVNWNGIPFFIARDVTVPQDSTWTLKDFVLASGMYMWQGAPSSKATCYLYSNNGNATGSTTNGQWNWVGFGVHTINPLGITLSGTGNSDIGFQIRGSYRIVVNGKVTLSSGQNASGGKYVTTTVQDSGANNWSAKYGMTGANFEFPAGRTTIPFHMDCAITITEANIAASKNSIQIGGISSSSSDYVTFSEVHVVIELIGT